MDKQESRPLILAIESSCDETAAAVMSGRKILANRIFSQEMHEKYGGVVPELASRAHQQNIVPVVSSALKKANVTIDEIDAFAFTQAPGLMGSLLVGTCFAKSLALSLNKPLIAVNHLQAHVLAHFIEEPNPSFPFICLLVSGGHTQLVLVKDYLDMEVIGRTLDDAAGEAFDKTAKIMGLPYPGGPLIDKLAKNGNPAAFKFPDADIAGYNYSFSGLKTSVLYFIRDNMRKDPHFITNNIDDISASVQFSIIRYLLVKLRKAMKDLNIRQVAVAGGVSANSGLRAALLEEGRKQGWDVFIPRFEYCTDNAAMIAMAAHYKYKAGLFEDMTVMPAARASF